MPDTIRVTRVCFSRPSAEEARQGVLGIVAFVMNDGMAYDSVRVRRRKDGGHRLLFPGRLDSKGRRHPFFRPSTQAVREEIERQVFDELRRLGVLP